MLPYTCHANTCTSASANDADFCKLRLVVQKQRREQTRQSRRKRRKRRNRRNETAATATTTTATTTPTTPAAAAAAATATVGHATWGRGSWRLLTQFMHIYSILFNYIHKYIYIYTRIYIHDMHMDITCSSGQVRLVPPTSISQSNGNFIKSRHKHIIAHPGQGRMAWVEELSRVVEDCFFNDLL